MIYTPLTNRAMQIAYQAHHGQADYNGIPYIFHPIHLAEQMDDELSCCVALLHDTVEDTEVTLQELQKEFSHPCQPGLQCFPGQLEAIFREKRKERKAAQQGSASRHQRQLMIFLPAAEHIDGGGQPEVGNDILLHHEREEQI